MTNPTGYWCPLCGDLPETHNPFPWIDGKAFHHVKCPGKIVPVYRPLDVPEVTTWGESGGAEAVTCRDSGWSTMATVYHVDDGHRWAYHEDGHWAIAGHGVTAKAGSVCHDTDITTAMNFLVGAK